MRMITQEIRIQKKNDDCEKSGQGLTTINYDDAYIVQLIQIYTYIMRKNFDAWEDFDSSRP